MKLPLFSSARFRMHGDLIYSSSTKILLILILLTLHGVNIQAQSRLLAKGVITGQNGEPLPGVSIMVKGTAKGTTSKEDGSFQIEVPSNATLIISHTGF